MITGCHFKRRAQVLLVSTLINFASLVKKANVAVGLQLSLALDRIF